jgi:UDP-N-acetylmuramate dehydrogenase
MLIFKNISLKEYNTFSLDYTADCMIRISTEKEALSLFRGEIFWKRPLLIVGRGSNILFISNIDGTILFPEIGGIKIEKQYAENVIISAGSGVSWDKLVEWSVKKGYGGLENLSLIPGTVGASAVQNIGAYGVEVKDNIEIVRAVSINDGTIIELNNSDCRFGYRDSILKGELKGKYLVTKVFFKLKVRPLPYLNYGSLKEEVEKLGSVTLANIRRAVINIRRSKLPDPEIIGNAGSFFKNPFISRSSAELLKNSYPLMPAYEDHSGRTKLAAGWLIDQAGWKGKRIGDAGVHDKQALVLVNHGKATGREIYNLSEEIKKSVLEKFGVELEREVEVVGII